MSRAEEAVLSIRDVAARTGVGQPTLRVWEARHGFPVPHRLPSGHRRYTERQVELVRQVVADRAAGLSLPAAIERVRGGAASDEAGERSIFAGLRRRRPDLVPHLLPKRTLVALSHAIEDECCARAERPVLLASFQRARFYRDAEPRWRELARTAAAAFVLADFPERRQSAAGPVEVPLEPDAPLGREWSLVCDAPRYAACLSAWERPGQDDTADAERLFETIWSVEPEVVRSAAEIARDLATRTAPADADRLSALLSQPPPPSSDQVRLAAALAGRMVVYLGGVESTPLPGPHSADHR